VRDVSSTKISLLLHTSQINMNVNVSTPVERRSRENVHVIKYDWDELEEVLEVGSDIYIHDPLLSAPPMYLVQSNNLVP
jgi:hypothetical protein